MKNQNQTVTNENPTIIFDAVAPHPEPVIIGELLADIETTIKRHVVLSDPAATALAVWVLHTYVFEVRDTVAYVAIESPEKRCGKTTLLSVLAAMANKPLIASNVTVGALFRAIDTCHPTLFIDEADTFLAGSGTMRGIINSGNTCRTAFVLRLARTKSKQSVAPKSRSERDEGGSRAQQSRDREGAGLTGDQQAHDDSRSPFSPLHSSSNTPSNSSLSPLHSPLSAPDTGLQKYSCWCPKVIAMIGKVPDTIGDRSIVVPMVRKLVTEIRAPLAELNADALKSKCARFARDNGQKIAQCAKIRGQGLNDRAADTFDPLYVIARLAGKEWEQKLHAAALALSHSHSRSPGIELLLDMHLVFTNTGHKKMFTRHLINVLSFEECGIGSMAFKYERIDEYQISDLLRPYGIRPRALRIQTEVGKGYVAEEIGEAVSRYVAKADIEKRLAEVQQHEKLMDEVIAEEDAALAKRR